MCEQQVERVVFEIILEQRAEVQKVGRNVATSQHRDVESTRRGSEPAANVATSQCRNVSTSRRLNIPTLQRRDVRANSASNIIKSTWSRNHGGIEERTNKGTESRAVATEISGEETYFCIFFFSNKTADVL